MHEKDKLENKLIIQVQGKTADLKKFNVIQYKLSDKEINFIAKLFSSQCNTAIDFQTNLIAISKQNSTGKEWSNKVF